MSVPYRDHWLKTVKYLTRTLEMSLSASDNIYETYRKQLKGDIVTVIIKINSDVEGPVLRTFLTRDGNVAENIWWHKQPHHSGYTLDYLEQFDKIDFVRVIIRNSVEFYDAWRVYADL